MLEQFKSEGFSEKEEYRTELIKHGVTDEQEIEKILGRSCVGQQVVFPEYYFEYYENVIQKEHVYDDKLEFATQMVAQTPALNYAIKSNLFDYPRGSSGSWSEIELDCTGHRMYLENIHRATNGYNWGTLASNDPLVTTMIPLVQGTNIHMCKLRTTLKMGPAPFQAFKPYHNKPFFANNDVEVRLFNPMGLTYYRLQAVDMEKRRRPSYLRFNPLDYVPAGRTESDIDCEVPNAFKPSEDYAYDWTYHPRLTVHYSEVMNDWNLHRWPFLNGLEVDEGIEPGDVLQYTYLDCDLNICDVCTKYVRQPFIIHKGKIIYHGESCPFFVNNDHTYSLFELTPETTNYLRYKLPQAHLTETMKYTFRDEFYPVEARKRAPLGIENYDQLGVDIYKYAKSLNIVPGITATLVTDQTKHLPQPLDFAGHFTSTLPVHNQGKEDKSEEEIQVTPESKPSMEQSVAQQMAELRKKEQDETELLYDQVIAQLRKELPDLKHPKDSQTTMHMLRSTTHPRAHVIDYSECCVRLHKRDENMDTLIKACCHTDSGVYQQCIVGGRCPMSHCPQCGNYPFKIVLEIGVSIRTFLVAGGKITSMPGTCCNHCSLNVTAYNYLDQYLTEMLQMTGNSKDQSYAIFLDFFSKNLTLQKEMISESMINSRSNDFEKWVTTAKIGFHKKNLLMLEEMAAIERRSQTGSSTKEDATTWERFKAFFTGDKADFENFSAATDKNAPDRSTWPRIFIALYTSLLWLVGMLFLNFPIWPVFLFYGIPFFIATVVFGPQHVYMGFKYWFNRAKKPDWRNTQSQGIAHTVAYILGCMVVLTAVLKLLVSIKRSFSELKSEVKNQGGKIHKSEGIVLMVKGIVQMMYHSATLTGLVPKDVAKWLKDKKTIAAFRDCLGSLDGLKAFLAGLRTFESDLPDNVFPWIINQGKEDEEKYDDEDWVENETFPGMDYGLSDDDEEIDDEERETFLKQFKAILKEKGFFLLGLCVIVSLIMLCIWYVRKRSVHNEGKEHRYDKRAGYELQGTEFEPEHASHMSNREKHVAEQRKGADMRLRRQQMENKFGDKLERDEELKRFLWSHTKYQWSGVDRTAQITRQIEPEKLMDYDVVHIRVGRFETSVLHPKKNSAEFMTKLAHIMRVAKEFDAKVTAFKPGDEAHLASIKNFAHTDAIKNEGGNLPLVLATLQTKVETVTSSSLTEDETKELVNSANPKQAVNKANQMILKRLEGKVVKNEGIRNEGSLGTKKICLTTVKHSIMRLKNNRYGHTCHAFTADNVNWSTAHTFYDIPLKQPDHAEAHEMVVIAGGIIIKDITSIDREKDICSFSTDRMLPSLKVNRGDYIGPGYIVTLVGEGNKEKISFGMIYKHRGILYHTCSTEDGDSGAPIFDINQQVVGIHKGYTGVSNVGVPFTALDAQSSLPVINQGAHFDFSYLPRACIPDIHYTDANKDKFYKTFLEIGEIDRSRVSYVGHYVGKNKEYNKFYQSNNYLETYKLFDLPDPEVGNFGIAKPNLKSIQKDFYKYMRPIKTDIDPDAFNIARKLLDRFIREKIGTNFPTYTADQAIDSFDGTKASGFPLNQKCRTKGDFRKQHRESLTKFIEMVFSGENPSVIFEQVGKEELRDMDRIILNKVRSFNSSAYHPLLIERMLFGGFLDAVATTPFFLTQTTSGWSPYYGGWDHLVKYMHGNYMYSDMDYVKWDSSLKKMVEEAVMDVIAGNCNWQPEHFIGHTWLKDNVVSCLALVPLEEGDNETIYALVKLLEGMKSGQLLTFVLNCFVNLFRHFYSMVRYFKITEAEFTVEHEEYIYHMKAISCGDDFAFTSDIMIKMQIYSKASAELGFELEAYIVHEGYSECPIKFIFAGLGTQRFGNVYLFNPDVNRLIFNISVIKKGMTPLQYIQKLDNMIRMFACVQPLLVQKLLSYRDFCVKQLVYQPGLVELARGLCTFHDAVAMHFELLEGRSLVGPLNPNEPEKNQGKLDDLSKPSMINSSARIHGNWVGPGWSAGKYQSSVADDSVDAVDEFDQTAKDHDFHYAQTDDPELLDYFDELFYKQNIGKGLKRTLSALAVKYFGKMARGKQISGKKKQIVARKAARKAKKVVARRSNQSHNGSVMRGGQSIPRLKAPTAVTRKRKGGKRSRPSTNKDGIIEKGTAYLGTVSVTSTTGVGDILNSLEVHPRTCANDMIKFFLNFYEKWKFIKWSVEYVPQVGTNTDGNILMYHDPDVYDAPGLNANAIPKGLSASRYADFPVYSKRTVSCKWPKGPQLWTSFDGVDNRNSSAGYVFVMSNSIFSAAKTMGTLVLHYELAFSGRLTEQDFAMSNAAQAYALNGWALTSWNGPAANQCVIDPNNDFTIKWLNSTTMQLNLPANTAGLTYGMYHVLAGTGINLTSITATGVGLSVANEIKPTTGVALTSATYRCALTTQAGFNSYSIQITYAGTATSYSNSIFTIWRQKSSFTASNPTHTTEVTKLRDRLANLEAMVKQLSIDSHLEEPEIDEDDNLEQRVAPTLFSGKSPSTVRVSEGYESKETRRLDTPRQKNRVCEF